MTLYITKSYDAKKKIDFIWFSTLFHSIFPTAINAPCISFQSQQLPNSAQPMDTPGHGWTTTSSLIHRYGHERRWIGWHSGGWTRLGTESKEHDAVTSESSNVGDRTMTDPSPAVRSLIAQLCEKFYRDGWATGTGGGVSIRIPTTTTSQWRVFVAPSGIQKEDMIGEDIFELDMDGNVVNPPITPRLRQSACTPLWYVVYRRRPTATCVIHTHSKNTVLATLLDETSSVVRITHLEMIKGVGNHAYDDILEIPVIENRPTEDLLAEQLDQAIVQYPHVNAVLVRRHGIYCWGDSWEQAKTQCESFDYLCECAVECHRLGIRVDQKPTTMEQHDNKKRKQPPPQQQTEQETIGFRGYEACVNRDDLQSNVIPLLPRDPIYRILLLDIEGCTTSIAFVHDVLFPYSRNHLHEFCTRQREDGSYDAYWQALQREMKSQPQQTSNTTTTTTTTSDTPLEDALLNLMDRDVKSPILKEIQGRIWQHGYESKQLQGHVYPDVLPALQWFQTHGIRVCIYSSGSIQAQKLLFGHSVDGNLLKYVSDHFDIPTAGPKKESSSYVRIAESLLLGVGPNDPSARQIVFVSDSCAELGAAHLAGFTAVASIRPGNEPYHGTCPFPKIFSLLQLCCAD